MEDLLNFGVIVCIIIGLGAAALVGLQFLTIILHHIF